MKGKNILAKLVLLPLSKIYGMVVGIRNFMFNIKLLKQKEFDVPIIVVGNIAVGGTGKTPHVEYIIEHLRHSFHIGVISRGYKRSTKGFVMATDRSTPMDIGDEPYQIYHKFNSEVMVAVCEDRVAGIAELLRIDPNINLVVMDDAFQHRYVKPTLAIVLTEFNRPAFEDKLLPYGRLREPKSALERADIIVATKCPDRIKALDFTIFEQNLNKITWQGLCFSRFVYERLTPVFPNAAKGLAPSLEWLSENDGLLIVAGIGNPRPFVRYIKRSKAKVRVNVFSDHHNFTRKDMALIQSRFDSMEGKRRYIITTEKDAVRLSNCPYFPHQLKQYIFYLPVKVEFMRNDAEEFINLIRKGIRNKRLSQK